VEASGTARGLCGWHGKTTMGGVSRCSSAFALQDMSTKDMAAWLQGAAKDMQRMDELITAAKGFVAAKTMGPDGEAMSFEVKPEDRKTEGGQT
jgi:hypothetical protein